MVGPVGALLCHPVLTLIVIVGVALLAPSLLTVGSPDGFQLFVLFAPGNSGYALVCLIGLFLFSWLWLTYWGGRLQDIALGRPYRWSMAVLRNQNLCLPKEANSGRRYAPGKSDADYPPSQVPLNKWTALGTFLDETPKMPGQGPFL